MAKPIKLITEVKGKDAEKFAREIANPSPDPRREETLRKAKALKVTFV